MSLDNIWLRSNDSFVRVSCVRFVYHSFVSCIVRSFACVFRIVRSFHFNRSFVYRAFVSCIVRFSYRSCETFVRLRLVRIVNLCDPGSISGNYRHNRPNAERANQTRNVNVILWRQRNYLSNKGSLAIFCHDRLC